MRLGRFGSDTKGSVAVVFSLATVPILLCSGAAIDYTHAVNERANVQRSLDAALLAAAAAPDSERDARARAVYGDHTGPSRQNEVVTFWTDAATKTYHGT